MKTIILFLNSIIFVSGCGSLENYIINRTYDFVDIFDVKIGFSNAFSLGAKFQVTDYFGFGVGLGWSNQMYEKYGRKVNKTINEKYFNCLVFGIENNGNLFNEDTTHLSISYFGIALHDIMKKAENVYFYNRLRIGFELWLPFINIGIYINSSEIADFILGFFGIDLMGDDDIPYNVNIPYDDNKK